MKKNSKSNRKVISSGLIWSFGERILAQVVTALVTIVLARTLEPDHFGIISIVSVFIAICNVFVTNGIGSALVQRKEIKGSDYDSALIINITLALVLYLFVFMMAPIISGYYSISILTQVIRVMGIRIPIAAINSIQQAYVRRRMEFKKFFFSTLIGTVISGVIGILMAIEGMGVWALVAQYLSNVVIDTVVLFLVNDWRPGLKFSATSALKTFSFGWKLLVSELIATLENNIKVLLSGRYFGPSALAFYEEGMRYPSLLTTNINAAINQVMLPAYSRKQDDINQLSYMVRQSVQIGFFLISPVMIGLAACAPNFVRLVLTDKWMGCVPFIQIYCMYYVTRPIEACCSQAIQALGKTNLVLYKMIVVNVAAFVLLLISVFYLKNIIFLAIASLITMGISMVINTIYVAKLLYYSVLQQLKDFAQAIFPALLMGAVVYLINMIDLMLIIKFILQIVTGVLLYVLFSYILNRRVFMYILKKGMVIKHQ